MDRLSFVRLASNLTSIGLGVSSFASALDKRVKPCSGYAFAFWCDTAKGYPTQNR